MYFRALGVLVVCGLLCAVSQGQLLNGGFEIPDEERPNEYYDPPLYPPLHWDFYDTAYNLNYVALHSEFIPQPEQGQVVRWFIPAPVEGEHFVLLSTGDSKGFRSESATEYSSIEQFITVNPGDVLSGYYFFGTCDYVPFNDTGLIKLLPADPNSGRDEIQLVKVSVSDPELGNYQATEGWQFFQYRFDENTNGEYLLYCEVRDIRDRIYKSYLALDGFRLCRNVPMYGDYNYDCVIDYHDVNILSRVWLADCNDPNVIADPNIPCEPFTVPMDSEELNTLNLYLYDPNIADPNVFDPNIVDPNVFDPNITDPNVVNQSTIDPNIIEPTPPHIVDLEYLLWISDHWLESFED